MVIRALHPSPAPARAVWEGNAFRLEKAEWKEETGEAEARGTKREIIAYLDEHGESALADLIDALAEIATESAVRQAVKSLEKAGVVRRTDSGGSGRGNNAYYVLSDSEKGSA